MVVGNARRHLCVFQSRVVLGRQQLGLTSATQDTHVKTNGRRTYLLGMWKNGYCVERYNNRNRPSPALTAENVSVIPTFARRVAQIFSLLIAATADPVPFRGPPSSPCYCVQYFRFIWNVRPNVRPRPRPPGKRAAFSPFRHVAEKNPKLTTVYTDNDTR